jgi:tRNA-2-methylthio-N6-dimethylallyladenosine synthase
MNEYDSEILQGLLTRNGFVISDSEESANIVLFNGCSVRRHAEKRVVGKAGMLKKRKERDNRLKAIGVIGCMAQAHKERLFDEMPYLDLICGPQHIYKIPEYLNIVLSGKGPVIAIDEDKRPVDRENHLLRNEDSKIKAYVTIMEGCNNFCSYCVVPYVRGREISRPPELILKEIETLVKRGIREITLLGQNVNSYAKDFNNGYKFSKLLKEADAVNDLKRLKFVTSHPKDADEEMFETMSKLPTVCEFLHLPVQSGSDRILKSMNRKYFRDDYLRKIELARKYMPHCSLSTDIIVGYPGESDEDFKATLDILKEVEYDTAYIFKYSPRPYTAASKMNDDVPQKVKEERNQTLLNLQRDIARKINDKYLNREIGVLVEGFSDKGDKLLVGKTRTAKTVVFEGPASLIGKIVEVKIHGTNASTLLGNWKKI